MNTKYVTTENVFDDNIRFTIYKSSYNKGVYLTFKSKNWILCKYRLLCILFGLGNYKVLILKENK